MILLFGNSFGAQATAYQLTGGRIPLVTILIGAQISGDVLHNPGLGLRAGDGHGRRSWPSRSCVYLVAPAARGALAPMTARTQHGSLWCARSFLRRGVAVLRSLPLHRDARLLAGHRDARLDARRRSRRTRTSFNDPRVLAQPQLLVRQSASSRSSSASPSSCRPRTGSGCRVPRAAPDRRVHHAAAVRHPAGRARVRADPALQPPAAAADATRDMGSNALLVARLRRAVAAVHVPRGRHRPARRSTSGR